MIYNKNFLYINMKLYVVMRRHSFFSILLSKYFCINRRKCRQRLVYIATKSHLNCVFFRLESLFNAQGVDMIIQAHEHSYERLYPLFDGKVERFNYLNPRAPVHVISGAAGSQEGTDGWTGKKQILFRYV